jgi:hypothetical protein
MTQAGHQLTVMKWSVVAAVAVVCLLFATRLWFVDGLLRRVLIDGPSIAPALCGDHFFVTCGDCGFAFRCDAEHVPADRLVACPNCGFIENSLDTARLMPPDRVLVDRWPLVWRGPRRGEVLALRSPDGDPSVKRVAGLPGEVLAIQGGDLFIGDRVVRKSLSELREVQLLLHDNACQPRKSPDLPPRWRPAHSTSRWQHERNGFRIEPSSAATETCDWLQYEHWPCTADPRSRGVASPILDNDAFNQGETRRSLNAVRDVLLTCRLQAIGAGRLSLAAVDGEQRFEVDLQPNGRVALRSGGQTLVDLPLKADFVGRPVEIEFGLCDAQLLLAIGGRTLLRYQYERAAGDQSEPLHPLAIGGSGIGLTIDNLRVWRDIYYLDPQGLPRRWQADSALPQWCFAALGDNQPISIDSRQWQPPGVPLSSILGRVCRPF